MKLAICQLNSVMGDIAGNVARIADALKQTAVQKPQLLIFPELFIQGYPPRDLLTHEWFIQDGLAALDTLCDVSRQYPGTAILTGIALKNTGTAGKPIFNSAVLIADGKILFHQHKTLLPTYDVFDESRYFAHAKDSDVFPFGNEVLGITICEDAWNGPGMGNKPLYDVDPVSRLVNKGATLCINISSSPFCYGKEQIRYELMAGHARRHHIPFVFVNQVGGNDELVFDGNSMVFDTSGQLQVLLPSFREEIRVIDTNAPLAPLPTPTFDTIRSIHDALILGISDYFRKCKVTGAIIGLSGGIDSAVTCALAAAALGPQNVVGVSMPSRYSSEGSKSDAQQLAENLGVRYAVVPVEPMFDSFLSTLMPHFNGQNTSVTKENLQARIRGSILMGFSNTLGYLVLSTGNKSEMAVGYCTLYGDMNGGLSVISDLPKTMVYDVARYINRKQAVIPDASITKPPSAELRPDQTDQDTLPPYDVLDAILELLVEQGLSTTEVTAKGFDAAIVKWIANAVVKNEYKRRQAAPGIKVTPKAFGMGRRFPIASKFSW